MLQTNDILIGFEADISACKLKKKQFVMVNAPKKVQIMM